MVGIEVFTQHFKDFYESYIVIGGVACEDHFDEELSSLSAILMDDEYYHFTIDNSKKGVAFHRADDLVGQIVKVFRLKN